MTQWQPTMCEIIDAYLNAHNKIYECYNKFYGHPSWGMRTGHHYVIGIHPHCISYGFFLEPAIRIVEQDITDPHCDIEDLLQPLFKWIDEVWADADAT